MNFVHPSRLLLLSASMILSSSALLAQGDTGFLRGPGKLDLALSYTVDSYDKFWVGTTKVSMPPVGEVERMGTSLYAAYGLREDMDVFLAAAYVETSADGTGGFSDENALQDAVGGVKWAFWRQRAGSGEFSLLFAPSIKQPLSSYEDDDVTAVGDGQTDLRGRVIAHYRHDLGFFASLETGYDRRNGAPDDEVPLHLTVGGTFAGRVTLSPFYSRVNSLGGIDISDVPAQGGFPATEEDYERAGIGAYVRLGDRFGVSGRWLTTLDGKNTGDVDSYSVGLVFNLL
jgi:hypothetical protein